jgi:hypothetical protein
VLTFKTKYEMTFEASNRESKLIQNVGESLEDEVMVSSQKVKYTPDKVIFRNKLSSDVS